MWPNYIVCCKKWGIAEQHCGSQDGLAVCIAIAVLGLGHSLEARCWARPLDSFETRIMLDLRMSQRSFTWVDARPPEVPAYVSPLTLCTRDNIVVSGVQSLDANLQEIPTWKEGGNEHLLSTDIRRLLGQRNNGFLTGRVLGAYASALQAKCLLEGRSVWVMTQELSTIILQAHDTPSDDMLQSRDRAVCRVLGTAALASVEVILLPVHVQGNHFVSAAVSLLGDSPRIVAYDSLEVYNQWAFVEGQLVPILKYVQRLVGEHKGAWPASLDMDNEATHIHCFHGPQQGRESGDCGAFVLFFFAWYLKVPLDLDPEGKCSRWALAPDKLMMWRHRILLDLADTTRAWQLIENGCRPPPMLQRTTPNGEGRLMGTTAYSMS